MRRELLGIEVAQAFYRDDDSALQALIAQANSGAAVAKKTPQSGAIEQAGSVTPLPDAAERLAQWQTQWDDWEGRLAAARAEVARVRAAPELSAPQREAAIETWITQRFDAAEQRRARALLLVPPG